MPEMLAGRIPSLIVKEFLSLLRDPKSRLTLMVPPIMQLVLFAFAATLEVTNVSLAVYNRDMGKHGYELVQRVAGAPTFSRIRFVQSVGEFTDLLDRQEILAAVSIPQDFSRRIEAGHAGTVQIVLDGRRSNAAQIVNGYITVLASQYALELTRGRDGDAPPVLIAERNWYNENLVYMWFTIPSLVGILSMVIALVVTALSVARERELGTFDQLLVSPLTPLEILAGKTVPAVCIGLVEALVIWAIGTTLFKVPFTGSFLLLVFTILLFIMSVVGVGLFISSVAKTQQQAILGAFVFLVPAITLSGYASPVENMPVWLQQATWVNPLKHALITLKGLFLKDMPFAEVWGNTWPLLVIGTVTLVLAGWFFARRLD